MRRPSAPPAWAAAVALALGSCAREPQAPRYNVILVTLDTTRADALGCYGQPDRLTPHFDALAAEGVRFELAVSTSAVTPVSHASILTGLNQYRHGLRVLSAGSGYRLPEDVPTIATVLQERGWRTAAIHSAFPVSAHFGLDRGYDRFDSFDVEMVETDEHHVWDVQRFQRRSDATTDLAIQLVRTSERPFFLWLHYWDPHDHWKLPTEEYLRALPASVQRRLGTFEGRYVAEAGYVDSQFGRLLQALEEAGLADDTIVAVTADHGEGLGEHDWMRHRILYQEQIHVPLILRIPGVAPATVPRLARTIDVFPTLLDYLGLAVPGDVDGRTLRPLIEGAPDEPRIAYADQINGYDLNATLVEKRPTADFLYCVLDGDWKLVYRPSHPGHNELFHLREDPDEAQNLWGTALEERRRLLRELAARNGWVTRPYAELGDEGRAARDVLGQLGYAGDGAGEAPGADDWAWACVEHPDELSAERGTCSRCPEPLLLVRRR